ncbi:hypothetical protein D1AOALGA4SA_8915 [Olavius algarvensis Delta 1 endosymbiont]|nr:hypothetical protein D1AOALGA4SA_8915 [Olavius algarvensis Delta 1 endosymbiont]
MWSTYIYFRIHVKRIIDGFEINFKNGQFSESGRRPYIPAVNLECRLSKINIYENFHSS